MPKTTNFLCKTRADYNFKDVDLNQKEIKRLRLHDPGYFIGRSYFGDGMTKLFCISAALHVLCCLLW